MESLTLFEPEKEIELVIEKENRDPVTAETVCQNGANCLRCKWLDRGRTQEWPGAGFTFYVCRFKELRNKAAAKRDNVKPLQFMPSDLTTEGKLYGYAWQCENKELTQEEERLLSEFDF
ncbi:MAG: hypothetical protein K6B75_06050 [Lachnospiraceae bacterium]|nr:hypothetical protein [Lachnospiraceae bacterium]